MNADADTRAAPLVSVEKARTSSEAIRPRDPHERETKRIRIGSSQREPGMSNSFGLGVPDASARCTLITPASPKGPAFTSNHQLHPPRHAETGRFLSSTFAANLVNHGTFVSNTSRLPPCSSLFQPTSNSQIIRKEYPAVPPVPATFGQFQDRAHDVQPLSPSRLGPPLPPCSQLFVLRSFPVFGESGAKLYDQTFYQLSEPELPPGLSSLSDEIVLDIMNQLCTAPGWCGANESSCLSLATTCKRFYRLYTIEFAKNLLLQNNSLLKPQDITHKYQAFPNLRCVCINNCSGVELSRKSQQEAWFSKPLTGIRGNVTSDVLLFRFRIQPCLPALKLCPLKRVSVQKLSFSTLETQAAFALKVLVLWFYSTRSFVVSRPSTAPRSKRKRLTYSQIMSRILSKS